ncbi:MAG: bifunctional phosphoglucose/phosphomannose isomerase [Nitrospinae bacterium]|nr:bifunctional phosphoglucose/phosphomannose isomerase [Nitrospinota bacterium]
MANLDDLEVLRVDRSGMVHLLVDFPEQVQEGERLGESAELPLAEDVRAIVVAGMGGSAIGGDLLRSYLNPECRVPIWVNRHYILPAFVGPETLVCAVSYSGDTEETLRAFEDARARGAKLLAVTSGGQLAEMAEQARVPCVRVAAGMPPRATLGYLFTPLLTILARLGLIPGQRAAIAETVELLREIAAQSRPGVETFRNQPKGLAMHLHEKFPAVYGVQDFSDVVAYRWRTQFNENSKVLASHHVFPELNHNEVVGWGAPLSLSQCVWVVFLRDTQELDRIARRIEITKTLLQEKAAWITEVWSQGRSRLTRLFSLLYLGDFTSYYLALLYGVDPTPVQAIDVLKQRSAEG